MNQSIVLFSTNEKFILHVFFGVFWKNKCLTNAVAFLYLLFVKTSESEKATNYGNVVMMRINI